MVLNRFGPQQFFLDLIWSKKKSSNLTMRLIVRYDVVPKNWQQSAHRWGILEAISFQGIKSHER